MQSLWCRKIVQFAFDRVTRGGHCISDYTPTRDRGQSEVKQSRRNSEGGQTVKQGIEGSLDSRNGQSRSRCSVGVVNAG